MPRSTYLRGRRFLSVWVERFARDNVLTTASAISFQLLTAAAALIFLFLALIGLFNQTTLWSDHIAPTLAARLPEPAFHALSTAVKHVFASSQVPLVVFASLLTTWEVSGAVRAVMGALNRVYGVEESRSTIRRFAVSFALAALISVLVLGAVILVLSGALGSSSGVIAVILTLLRWAGALVLLLLAIAALTRFAPVKVQPWRFVSAGSILTVVAWAVLSLGYRIYLEDVASLRSPEGLLTLVLSSAGYLYTSSIAFLVGVECNDVMARDNRN
jgi:membrane protein